MNGFQKWLARTVLGFDTRSITYAETLPRYMHMQPQRPAWSIENAVKEGYKVSSIVYLCVKRKADSVSSIPYVLKQRDRRGELVKVESGPLVELLAHPNEMQTLSKLLWRWSAHLSLGGNAIISKVRVADQVEQLWPLFPQGIYPVTRTGDGRLLSAREQTENNQGKFINHYELERGGVSARLELADVIHDQLPDPQWAFWGIGELQALAQSVDTDVYSQRHFSSSMQNRGMLTGIVSMKNSPTKEQYQTTKNFIQHEFIGTENAGKIAVLDQDLDYHQLTQNFKDIEFIEARRLTREEIAIGFGWDPLALGFGQGATFANKQWARYISWVDTLIPRSRDLAQELAQGLVSEFYSNVEPDEFVIEPDFSKVEALTTMYKERADVAVKLIKGAGYDADEVSAKLDLGLRKAQVVNPPTPPPLDDDDEVEGATRRLRRSKRTTYERVQYWKRSNNRRTQQEQVVARAVADIFARFGPQVANAYSEFGSTAVYQAMAREREYWRVVLGGVYQAGSEVFGDALHRELFDRGAPDLWRSTAELIAEGLSPDRVDLINDASVRKVTQLLELATSNGLDAATTSQGLEALYSRWQNARSMTIATSEVGLIMGHAQFEMGRLIQAQGDPLSKEWISRQDGEVRDSHVDVDGEIVALEERFSNGLLYPGDPAGPPEETINCRCILGYQLEGV
ncbi:MAG: phage portal protein [Deinococcota bacterium]